MISRAMTIIGLPVIGFLLMALWQAGNGIATRQTEILTSLAVIQQEILEQNRRIELLERRMNVFDSNHLRPGDR